MRAPFAFALVVLAAFVPLARDARAKHGAVSPPGLELPGERVPAQGVQALRAPRAGRVHIASATFQMGSTLSEMADALKMCHSPTLSPIPSKQEILAQFLCDEDSSIRAEGYAHQVTLHAFEMDRTEVSVADYERCVLAGPCDAPGFTRGDPRFDRPRYPVTQIRWDDAERYCHWAGGRLPTEAEWEYAARGDARRLFPWGDVYNPHLANHGALATDDTDASDGFALLAPVGSYPDGATPEGILDLAGNVGEWVQDFDYEADSEGYGYSPMPAVDPVGPPTGVGHLVRGGSYARPAWRLRGAAREELLLPRSAEVGFRCVNDVR
jgi:formylglycine-generating enzyme required for sulfatase activity